jgi:hypothetical protein
MMARYVPQGIAVVDTAAPLKLVFTNFYHYNVAGTLSEQQKTEAMVKYENCRLAHRSQWLGLKSKVSCAKHTASHSK